MVNVRTEDQHTGLFTMPLDMQKFHKRANTVLNVVMRFECWGIPVLASIAKWGCLISGLIIAVRYQVKDQYGRWNMEAQRK